MSVLVNGMKMPKYGCRDCIFVNFNWYGDVCPILKKEVTENIARCGFHPDCPLVEVPPHGRLADIDAVISVLEEMSKEYPPDSIGRYWISNFSDILKAASTVIPATEASEAE